MLFTQQPTPYVYPPLKAHKVRCVKKSPPRLVAGMGNCQMTRIQAWLENFLSPLSQEFGSFEYTKDSSTVLREISNLNRKIDSEHYESTKCSFLQLMLKLYTHLSNSHIFIWLYDTALRYAQVGRN